jgi:hypothetical protein
MRESDSLPESRDDHFASIVGYTPGGFPCGITWEEWDAAGLGEQRTEPR